MSRLPRPLSDRFWEKVNLPEDRTKCWEWNGSKKTSGHGEIRIDGKNKDVASRVSLFLHGYKLDDSDVVHHLCENPSCVNPNHLKIFPNNIEHMKKHRHWSREKIIDSMQKFNIEFGRPPISTDWNPASAQAQGHHERARLARERKQDWPHPTTVIKYFGSWAAAISLAGFQRPVSGRYDRNHKWQ